MRLIEERKAPGIVPVAPGTHFQAAKRSLCHFLTPPEHDACPGCYHPIHRDTWNSLHNGPQRAASPASHGGLPGYPVKRSLNAQEGLVRRDLGESLSVPVRKSLPKLCRTAAERPAVDPSRWRWAMARRRTLSVAWCDPCDQMTRQTLTGRCTNCQAEG